mmetsp:Transcript_7856/g.17416  ORF Transcript_7856/g.17416 Transcript_7856/m.17416 type:complete len:638 (+) Transcript_7856:49-1962(+)
MSNRETQYSSIGQCPFEDAQVAPVNGHLRVISTGMEADAEEGSSPLKCTMSKPGAVVRLQQMQLTRNNKSPRWGNDQYFHEQLQIPQSSKDGACLLFEGMAREGIAIALSPEKRFAFGYTYECVFGERGNTVVLLRRKTKAKGGPDSESLVTQRPSRVCAENAWTSYWVCLWQGKLYAGLGEVAGEQCVALLDDIARQDQPAPDEKSARYIGFGNSGTGDRQAPGAVKIRNIKLTSVPPSIISKLNKINEEDLEFVAIGEDEMDEETKTLLLQYKEECQKARARAKKFGTVYKDPPTFLPWSHIRRLRANPQQGFVTGINLQSQEEKDKLEARKNRFGTSSTSNAPEDTTSSTEQENTANATEEEQLSISLPTSQAWDNEKLVLEHRTDPPMSLWKEVPELAEDEQSSLQYEATLAGDKIHLFSIDWAAFKQIRTNDVMSYFTGFGPTYVEWLGDLSCNVHFQDKFSASRALANLSTELPFPPPSPERQNDETETAEAAEKSDLGRMGWSLGKTPLRKIANDRFGRRGTTARVLLRVATSLDVLQDRPNSWPKPPPGFSTKRVLGPGSDFPQQTKKKSQKKRKSGEAKQRKVEERTENGEPSMLDRGLTAVRAGFSTEELEAERAKKRIKTTEASSY